MEVEKNEIERKKIIGHLSKLLEVSSGVMVQVRL